jgi:hypothetical protein
MDYIVQENCWKYFMLTEWPADSGTAETYTADRDKMAAPPQA